MPMQEKELHMVLYNVALFAEFGNTLDITRKEKELHMAPYNVAYELVMSWLWPDCENNRIFLS